MCKIFSLVLSKKPCHQRKLRQTKCLLFNFWMIKMTKTPIVLNWPVPNGFFFGITVNFIIQKLMYFLMHSTMCKKSFRICKLFKNFWSPQCKYYLKRQTYNNDVNSTCMSGRASSCSNSHYSTGTSSVDILMKVICRNSTFVQ